MKIIINIVLIVLSLYSTKVWGQEANVKLKNLRVTTNNNSILNDSTYVKGTNTYLTISFKMDTLANCDSVFLKVKSAENGVISLSEDFKVTTIGGVYYLEAGSNSFQVYGLKAYLKYTILIDDLNNHLYYEIQAKDKNGVLTPVIDLNL